MNYLSCANCGHHNPVTSEFLTFCNRCSKKLRNNYADWKQKYPDQNYETFLQEMTTSQQNNLSQRPQDNWCKRYSTTAGRKGIMLLVCSVFLLIAVTGTIFGKRLVITWFYPGVSKAWCYTTWETVTIGRQAIQISTPVHLRINDKPLPPDMASSIMYHKNYSNDKEEGMRIEVKFYSFLKNTSNSLPGAAEQTLNNMTLEEDITDIRHTEATRESTGGVNSLIQQGTYSYKKAIRLAFSNLVMVKGQHRWLITIHHRAGDENGREVAERILRSVSVKGIY